MILKWQGRLHGLSKESLRALLPTRPSPHVILAGPLRGARIFTSWHDYPGAILGTTERPLLNWFAKNVAPGETWLDIGAHYGYTAIALSRLVGGAGRVFAFEPLPRTAGCLARTRDLNSLRQLTVVPLALTDQPELHTLRLPAIRGMADSTVSDTSALETIYAISLDSFLLSAMNSNAPVHGVKIDVQGMELQVLLGMRSLLDRWAPKLVVEFHYGVDRREILDLLASVGYAMAPEPVSFRGPFGVIANDMSYVFQAEVSECAFSFTRLTTGRN